jgi:hypothetical protein
MTFRARGKAFWVLLIMGVALNAAPVAAAPVHDGWHLYTNGEARNKENCKNILEASRRQDEQWPRTTYPHESKWHKRVDSTTKPDYSRVPLLNNSEGAGYQSATLNRISRKGDNVSLYPLLPLSKTQVYAHDGTVYAAAKGTDKKAGWALRMIFLYARLDDARLDNVGLSLPALGGPEANSAQLLCIYSDDEYKRDGRLKSSQCMPYSELDIDAAIRASYAFFKEKTGTTLDSKGLLPSETRSIDPSIYDYVIGDFFSPNYGAPSYLLVTSSRFTKKLGDYEEAILDYGNPSGLPLSVIAFTLEKNTHDGKETLELEPACLFQLDQESRPEYDLYQQLIRAGKLFNPEKDLMRYIVREDLVEAKEAYLLVKKSIETLQKNDPKALDEVYVTNYGFDEDSYDTFNAAVEIRNDLKRTNEAIALIQKKIDNHPDAAPKSGGAATGQPKK